MHRINFYPSKLLNVKDFCHLRASYLETAVEQHSATLFFSKCPQYGYKSDKDAYRDNVGALPGCMYKFKFIDPPF